MSRSACRRGFTRIDLSVALAIGLACISLLIPACGKAVNTEKEKEDEQNVKEIGQGAHQMFDQMPGNHRIRVSAARSQSSNNLKQIGIGANSLATTTDGRLPPAVGTFPGANGPNATVFYHLLPFIEQQNYYNLYQMDPTKIPETAVIRTYCSPLDPSNDCKAALCSYAANAAVFGMMNGGSARFPASFNVKGTSNTILFFEHYARPVVKADGTTVSNYWYSPSTALYTGALDFGNPNAWQAIKNPQFNVPYDGDDPRPDNGTAHGFVTDKLLAGLADGSVRVLTKDVTKLVSLPVGNERLRASPWQWACCVQGPLGAAPPPEGW
jgi:hypothetical protein